MPISNWSSDRCSSDLVDVRASRRLSVDAASPDQTVQTFRRRKRMHNSTRLMLIAAPLALAACDAGDRSEEHTSELQSLMRISYAVFCLHKKNNPPHHETETQDRTAYKDNSQRRNAIAQ